MKARYILFLLIILCTLVIPSSGSEVNDQAVSYYMGQEPPGLAPKVFAPGVISLGNRYEQNGSFTPDGNEFCFAVTNSGWSTCNAWYTRYEQGQWLQAARADFVGSGDVWCPCLSPDGEGFYFVSSRPSYPPSNVWKCEKSLDSWSAPVKMDYPVSSGRDEWGFSLLPDKTIYFCSHRPGGSGGCDIWYCRYLDGEYEQAVNISALNTSGNDCAPCISPDENFLVFNSTRSGGYGSADLYIAFRLEDGSWTRPQNLGPNINTSNAEMSFSLSPDKKYAFFTRRTNNDSDINWVDIRAILPDPNGPIENLSTGQRFGSLQTAINYAQSGNTLKIEPGIYNESVIVKKDVKIQSLEPDNPLLVGSTILNGLSEQPVITLENNSDSCEVAGLTIRAGAIGISGISTNAVIRNCRIMDNTTYGVKLSQESKPYLQNCLITANGQAGILMLPGSGRGSPPCEPRIEGCVIVQNNGDGIVGGEPVIIDSIID